MTGDKIPPTEHDNIRQDIIPVQGLCRQSFVVKTIRSASIIRTRDDRDDGWYLVSPAGVNKTRRQQ